MPVRACTINLFCFPTDYSPSSSTHSEDHLPPTMTPYQPHSHSVQSKKLEFWYVSPEGRHVTSKDQAAVAFNGMEIFHYVVNIFHPYPELSVGFLVKCRRKDLEESFFNYTIDKLRYAHVHAGMLLYDTFFVCTDHLMESMYLPTSVTSRGQTIQTLHLSMATPPTLVPPTPRLKYWKHLSPVEMFQKL